MAVSVRMLGSDEAALLERVAPDVFDGPLDPHWTAAFLAEPQHHMAVALDGDLVVGMASALRYLHPDKAPELWINEVGVAPTHQRQGIGQQLLRCLLAQAQNLGCVQAWVLTEQGNQAARALYASAGGSEAAEPVILVEFDL